MQVVQIDTSLRGTRKSGRWSRAPRHRAVGPGVAAAVAGLIGLGALAATLLAGRTGGGQRVTIPANSILVAASQELLSTTETPVGQTVTFETREPLKVSEDFTLPAGFVIRGQVLRSTGGNGETPELAIGFTEIEVAGTRYGIAAEPFRIGAPKAEPSSRRAGAAVGDRLGETGLDDAAAEAAMTGKDQIVLPAGQRIRIRLSEPVSIRFNGSRTRGN